MSEGTPTSFAVPFVCTNGHDQTEASVRVLTIVQLSNGRETPVPLPIPSARTTVGRDTPPGRPVMPLHGVPADRQRDKYEFKCRACNRRYELRSENALRLVADAVQAGSAVIDLYRLGL